MGKMMKTIKKRFGKGFTFLIVPNTGGAVKSYAIPFSLALLIIAIIGFNLYIFVGYTTQIKQIHRFQTKIQSQDNKISELLTEQREVRPTLEKSYRMAEELTELKKERSRILSTWRSIMQKSGRTATTSRGAIIRNTSYTISPRMKAENETRSELADLKYNLNQVEGFIKEEAQSQHQLWLDLLAYERRLDHTPSIWPVRSFITSIFGFRLHPTLGYYKEHTGVDLQARYGSRVAAAADGRVVFSGYKSGYGYTVILDHEYGYQTLYGHNSKLLVRVGQVVKKGQIISLSGNSGTSTGPHLHYEVHVHNHAVNPISFLRN